MFQPQYTISEKLLGNIKRIAVISAELNRRTFPHTILAKFENRASSLSTYASTSIEGNPLPLTDVKRILKSRPANLRNTEREVINYNNSLEQLNDKIRQGPLALSIKLVCEVQKQVTSGLLEKYRSGKLRSEPVFVNDPKSGKPMYLPPDHQNVPALMRDLIEFVRTSRHHLDPLILAGLFHKQFVIIHPFIDGNGRTIRLLTKALLADMGLDTFNLFSFENYYNRNVTKYFKTVGVFGNYYEIAESIQFTEWLEYFTDGLIDELLRVQKELENESMTPDTSLQVHHNVILDTIQKNGFITDRDYSKLTGRAKATRVLDFNRLMDLGLIERLGKGRSVYYKMK